MLYRIVKTKNDTYIIQKKVNLFFWETIRNPYGNSILYISVFNTEKAAEEALYYYVKKPEVVKTIRI